MATHWSAEGTADGTMSKTTALLLIPTLTLALVALFAFIPRIDPLGENVERFRAHYDRFVVLFTAFMVYVHLLVVAWNLGYHFEFGTALAPAIGGLYYFVGTLMDEVEPNWFVGVRTPWTLSSEEVWDRTHARASPLFKLAGVVAVLGVVVPEYAVYLMVGPVAAVALYLTAYSYVAYRHTAA